MAKAKLLLHRKTRYDDGAIREVVIWQLPAPEPSRPHGLKYRLYYGKDGRRLVGYDNELGKGDHKHIGHKEHRYNFISVEQLINDFMLDIKEVRENEY